MTSSGTDCQPLSPIAQSIALHRLWHRVTGMSYAYSKMAANSSHQQKSLEEMLASEVDESEITALVGSLETQLDPRQHTRTAATAPAEALKTIINSNPINNTNTITTDTAVLSQPIITTTTSRPPSQPQLVVVANKQTVNTTASAAVTDANSVVNHRLNNNNSVNNSTAQLLASAPSGGQQMVINSQPPPQPQPLPVAHKTTLKIMTNNNNNNTNSVNIAVNSNNNLNNTNKMLTTGQPPPIGQTSVATLPGALPASGYISQVTNASNPTMNSVTTAPGMAANQIIKNAIQVSAMANGSPAGSPSPLQQSLQSGLQLRGPTPGAGGQHTPTTISLSAITPSLVINKSGANAGAGGPHKPGQTLLIATTKDGPMIVQPSGHPLVGQQTMTSGATDGAANHGPGGGGASMVTLASRTAPGNAGSGAGQPTNLMQQLVSNHPNQIFQLVTNMNASRPQGAGGPGVGPNARTLAPRMVQLPANMRLTPQVLRPGGPSGFGPGTITLPSNLVRAGTIFVKTENGQVHMVNVGPQPTSGPNAAPNATTYRLQVPTTVGGATGVPGGPSPATAMRTITNPIVMSMPGGHLQGKATAASAAVQQQPPMTTPLTISTTAANASGATPSQMSPNTAKKKCKNFLSTLIRLASDQPPNVATNVKNLIQGLIDDAIQPEDFTNQLQRELNSSPQPCLVPFLKKSLPYLRFSLMQKELTIEGVRPPPNGTVTLPTNSQHIPQIQIAQTGPRPGIGQTVRLLTPVGGLMGSPATTVLTPMTQTGARLQAPQTMVRPPVVASTPSTGTTSTPSSRSKSSAKSRSSAAKDKEKKNSSNFSSTLRDDDDINDVAAMGGVNLQEESQRILSNAETVGQQIRSCKDEDFLFTNPLHKRINEIASKYGLDECSTEVVSLVSHAVQERLKTLVEKLGVIAEHRQEQVKSYGHYEVVQDVKGQTTFLQELDRIEKRRHEEHPVFKIAQTGPRPGIGQTVRLLTPVGGLMGSPATTVLTPMTQTGARLQAPQTMVRPPVVASTPSTGTTSTPSSRSKSSAKSRSSAAKDKEKKNSSNFSSTLRDDDDINDVAAMGGVNLQEESQRILSNAETVGQQIRSCKDEDFLFTNPLHKRINEIASKYGLDECSTEVVSLVSHAVQERLKTLVEKLGVIAEHRQEQVKSYGHYEVVQDVKGQTTFLQELDRIEKRRHEE
ncbi:unnamed protein product, partial [Medioppia subpectinata]